MHYKKDIIKVRLREISCPLMVFFSKAEMDMGRLVTLQHSVARGGGPGRIGLLIEHADLPPSS